MLKYEKRHINISNSMQDVTFTKIKANVKSDNKYRDVTRPQAQQASISPLTDTKQSFSKSKTDHTSSNSSNGQFTPTPQAVVTPISPLPLPLPSIQCLDWPLDSNLAGTMQQYHPASHYYVSSSSISGASNLSPSHHHDAYPLPRVPWLPPLPNAHWFPLSSIAPPQIFEFPSQPNSSTSSSSFSSVHTSMPIAFHDYPMGAAGISTTPSLSPHSPSPNTYQEHPPIHVGTMMHSPIFDMFGGHSTHKPPSLLSYPSTVPRKTLLARKNQTTSPNDDTLSSSLSGEQTPVSKAITTVSTAELANSLPFLNQGTTFLQSQPSALLSTRSYRPVHPKIQPVESDLTVPVPKAADDALTNRPLTFINGSPEAKLKRRRTRHRRTYYTIIHDFTKEDDDGACRFASLNGQTPQVLATVPKRSNSLPSTTPTRPAPSRSISLTTNTTSSYPVLTFKQYHIKGANSSLKKDETSSNVRRPQRSQSEGDIRKRHSKSDWKNATLTVRDDINQSRLDLDPDDNIAKSNDETLVLESSSGCRDGEKEAVDMLSALSEHSTDDRVSQGAPTTSSFSPPSALLSLPSSVTMTQQKRELLTMPSHAATRSSKLSKCAGFTTCQLPKPESQSSPSSASSSRSSSGGAPSLSSPSSCRSATRSLSSPSWQLSYSYPAVHACSECGKAYKHSSCLQKHLWEHSEYWHEAKKYSLTKHQQVQIMEAAQILLALDRI